MTPLLLALLLACHPKQDGPPAGWTELPPPEATAAAANAPATPPEAAPPPNDAAAPPAADAPQAAPEAPAGAAPDGSPPAGLPEGAPCLKADQCASGVCEGEGCRDEVPGRCTALTRPCTRDLVTYCGCDLKTFQSSGSCPMRRYLHRGPCGEEAP